MLVYLCIQADFITDSYYLKEINGLDEGRVFARSSGLVMLKLVQTPMSSKTREELIG